MNSERDQEAHENYINSFSEKVLTWGKWAIFSLEMACPHTSGPTLRISLKFCIMREPKRYMELVLMVFLKKIFIWGKWTILAWKLHVITLDPLKEFFLNIAEWKGRRRSWKLILMVFPEKNISLGKSAILDLKMVWLHNSRTTLWIFF